jgi:hypothetical protein
LRECKNLVLTALCVTKKTIALDGAIVLKCGLLERSTAAPAPKPATVALAAWRPRIRARSGELNQYYIDATF